MKSFSLGKLKDKVGRRFSDPSAEFDRTSFVSSHRRNSHSNEDVFVSESEESFPSISGSLAISGDRGHRSRSISVSRKQAKQLIRQETSHVIQKKLLSVLKDLGLQLPIPLKTSSGGIGTAPSKSTKIYVANTHDCVFLASSVSTSFTYEDTENGGNQIPESHSNTDLNGTFGDNLDASRSSTPRSSVNYNGTETPEESSSVINTIARKMRALKSANYLCTQIDSENPIPHLFAVIVELSKDSSSKTIEVEFSSTTKTQWPSNDSANRHQSEDSFKIGTLSWELNFQDADLFINSKNSKDTHLKDIDPQHLAEKTREFKLFDARKTSCDIPDDTSVFSGSHRPSIDSTFSANTEPVADIQKAGLYVFLLPILIPPNIPATVNTVNGTLAHKLSVRIPGSHEKLSKKLAVSANYNLPMVRTPPSLANSIADKPIYVNRIWNESLHYSITFPKKYISLGSEHTINVKLVPMAKDVTVKRIKFNILEKLTYVSKDLTREYEYDGDDPFTRSRNSKSKERIVPLCELRTKSKSNYSGAEPFKEEVISCPDNNLLFSCYEDRPATADSSRSRDKSVMVASPLDISIALPFLTSKADKEIMTSSISEDPQGKSRSNSLAPGRYAPKRDSVASLETPSSPVIGSLETHISHLNGGQLSGESMEEDILRLDSSSFLPNKSVGRNDSISKGYTITSKALSPDSNFRHIQISHRLQVSFRISKPDAADNNKMHHYEVVVDTPIILLSAKCNDGSMQLPEYDEFRAAPPQTPPQRPGGISFRTPSYVGNGVSIKPFDPSATEALPTFEEATSAPASPIMRSTSVTSLDPSTPADPPAYENVPFNDELQYSQGARTIDDLLVEPNLNLSGRKPSAIKASLQSSFAPSINTNSGSSGHSDESPNDQGSQSLQSSHSDEASSSLSSDETSSRSMHSSVESSSLNEAVSSVSLDEPITSANSDSVRIDESASILQADVDEIDNVVADEVQYDQRLPLLRNESMGGAKPQGSKLSFRTKGLVLDEWKKMSTETLSEQAEAQSLFHAY